jgi:SpoVK/Ycf46/Vps4 family AAA+-type ATPase
MPDVLERLKVLFNSFNPLLVMETVEETRAVDLVRRAASDLSLPVFEWSIADGLQRSGAPVNPGPADPRRTTGVNNVNALLSQAGLPMVNIPPGMALPAPVGPSSMIVNTQSAPGVLAHIESMTTDAVFILKDLHRHLDDVVVVRRLRQVAQNFTRTRGTLVLTGPAVNLPDEVESLAEYVELPLPDAARLRKIIEETFGRLAQKQTLKCTLDPAGFDATAANLRGLTEEEAERTVAQVIVARYALSSAAVTDVLEQKKEVLRRSGMLEFIDAGAGLDSIGGLENLKAWLRKRQGAFEPDARGFGLEPPRGVVIMGVQGCGKSMSARCIAGEWKLPLVKFDSAAVFDKYIGETEKRIKRVFAVAEQLAPAVLWIDELEKVFAGSGPDSASSDAGVSSRLLGAFLSWMQDRKAPVFVAATSNNVTWLPPELIRKGRFDEIFFVDLPNAAERQAIFRLQLARRMQNPLVFDLETLIAASDGYSGAEIDAAIQSGLYAAYADKKPLTTQVLLAELKATVPLSATRAEDIARLRDWASQRAVHASLTDRAAAAFR